MATCAKKTKKKTKKLKELSLLGRGKERIIHPFPLATSACVRLSFRLNPKTNLKALYTGRYQQTKEHGVKRRAQRMARPRPTPLDEGSMQNMAREEIRFRSSVPVLTKTEKIADALKNLLTAQAVKPFQRQ